MRFKHYKAAIAITAVALISLVICICAVSCSAKKLVYKNVYYIVCYREPANSVSASSLSGTVSSYGGAGYILNIDGNYLVTVACYYSEQNAKTVCESLKHKNLDCTVKKIETESYKISRSLYNKCEKLFTGNLNTLNSLSSLAYDCANKLDTGEYNQSKAKSIISEIKSGLNGLKQANTDNCFSEHINMLTAQCDDKEKGYVYSKDLRYIQIAVIDVIVNIKLV